MYLLMRFYDFYFDLILKPTADYDIICSRKNNMKKSLEESAEYVINTFYSLNYSCLRVAYQDGIFPHTGLIYTSRDIFGNKKIKNVWLSSKLSESATERNKEMSEFLKTLEKENINNENIKLINLFEQTKQMLITQYNTVFETNHSFDEIFDGFFCKGTDLDKLINFFYETNIITKSIESCELVKLYYDYQEALKTFMIVESMMMISDALMNDIASNGIPTLQYGVSHPNILQQISTKEFSKYYHKAIHIKTTISSIANEKRKHLNSLIKSQKRRKITHTEKLLPQIDILRGELFDLNCDINICETLMKQLKKLQNRFLSANKNFQNSELTNQCEKFFDFLLGVETKCDEFSVDSVYITNTERNYIEYLFSQLKQYELIKTESEEIKTNTKTSQPNK